MKFILLVLSVASLGSHTIPQTVSGSESRALFVLNEAPRELPAENRISVASQREANITFDPVVIASMPNTITFPLFDGRVFTAQRYSGASKAVWNGKIIAPDFDGDVILTFNEGFVAGLIYSPAGVYEITPYRDKHLLMEIDQSALPECGGEVPSETAPFVREPAAGVESGDRIDVLVMYTTATKNTLGGDAQARTHAQQAVNSSNVAYLNSQIRMRLNLVQAVEYAYVESPTTQTDLANLRADQNVQNLRNEYNADLVAMIGEVQGVCGVAYLMGPVGGNPNTGFSVTGRVCAVSTLSFAHELGHNMGSHHNPENGSGPTYPYGFGHYVNGSFRTVMSYSNQCTVTCDRRAYFSNPGVFRGPHPTGIENERDNARSINNTADTIANYRYSGASISMDSTGNSTTIPRLIGKDLRWTSDGLTGNVRIELSRDQGFTWTTIVEDTPDDGFERIHVNGRPTKRARLRISSIDHIGVSDSNVTDIAIR